MKITISQNTRYALLGISLAIMIVGSAIIGAHYSCTAGEGALIGLKCMKLNVTGVCTIDGDPYRMPSGPLKKGTYENVSLPA